MQKRELLIACEGGSQFMWGQYNLIPVLLLNLQGHVEQRRQGGG